SATITAEGETLVQFRSQDAAGNASAWAPASPIAGNTVRLDRLPPTIPTISGGSSTWQSVPSVNVSATGGRGRGSGGASDEYRPSMANGATWSRPSPGATATVTAEGVTLVQFRSVDGMGFVSGWAPSSATSASTVKLDHTAPAAPNVAGGSASWQSGAPVVVTGSGAAHTGRPRLPRRQAPPAAPGRAARA